jgi:DNA polymerase III sliding clamp (beta) subunit (PCNA family)
MKTQKLQEMMQRAVKGASNNRMVPITGLIGLEVKDNILTLLTTDATNHIRVRAPLENDDFYAVIQVDLFNRLIQKTTTETVCLTLKENSLEVKGNGVYNIDLPLDENGSTITFPDFKFNTKIAKTSKIKLSAIKTILSSNKAALAETMELPCLAGYYFSDKVITTDTFKVCCNAISVFEKDSVLLLSSEMINLLGLMTAEEIEIKQEKDKLLFITDDMIIYGTQLDDIAKYPADAIGKYLETAFESVCRFPKMALLDVLDRLMLFVTEYDKNSIYVTFSESELVISSKKQNGTETITLTENKNFKPFTCCIDIELLQSQVMAQSGQTTELWYGHPSAIKMTDDTVTQIIALLEDDRKGA